MKIQNPSLLGLAVFAVAFFGCGLPEEALLVEGGSAIEQSLEVPEVCVAGKIAYGPANLWFQVPPGCKEVRVKAWGGGASYGNVLGCVPSAPTPGNGGGGGFVHASLAVQPGENLRVQVSSTPGTTCGGFLIGGGRVSFVQRENGRYALVAGGGGMGGFASDAGVNGGGAGGLFGASGDPAPDGACGGGGGTQTDGGAGGCAPDGGSAGGPGSFMMYGTSWSAEGGQGWFGGGGAGYPANASAGGGGGSSYAPAGAKIEAAIGRIPGGFNDPDRNGAGEGGVYSPLHQPTAGRIVISWGQPTVSAAE